VKATCVCLGIAGADGRCSKDGADLAERCGTVSDACFARGPGRRLTGDTRSIAETTEEGVNPATVSSRELREKFAKEQTKRLHKNRSPWKPDREEAEAWTESRSSRELTFMGSLPLRYPTSAIGWTLFRIHDCPPLSAFLSGTTAIRNTSCLEAERYSIG